VWEGDDGCTNPEHRYRPAGGLLYLPEPPGLGVVA
jgi:hypothetical protein